MPITNQERARRQSLVAQGLYVCTARGCEHGGAPQPLACFTRDARSAFGLSYKCKDCGYRAANTPEAVAARKRYRESERARKVQREVARRVRNNPAHAERLRARWTVHNAVRLGNLPRASTRNCVQCGNPARDYHHHRGYDDAHLLDVVPVCRPCHLAADWPVGTRRRDQPPVVLPGEIRRSSACNRGHPWVEGSHWRNPKRGNRTCYVCRRERDAARQRERRAK